MLETSRLLDFCITNNLDVEEYTLLNNLYLRNEQINPELFPLMDKYYRRNSSRGRKYVQMIKDLENRGFLETLKDIEEGSVEIKNLKISDKFSELLFINPEEYFERFYKAYPRKGILDGKEFTANMITKDTKENFNKYVLKGANKQEGNAIMYIISEMFNVGLDGKPDPNVYAIIGIDRFCMNWQTIKEQWEEEQRNPANGNWSTRRY